MHERCGKTLPFRFALIFAFAVWCLASFRIQAFASGDTSSLFRKKLFLIERRLARVSGGFDDPLRNLIAPVDTESWLADIRDSVGDAPATDEASPVSASSDAVDNEKDMGSVTAALGDGKLTGFSLSQTGLDLSTQLPDFAPTIFLKSASPDLDKLGGDESMDNSFSSSQNPFFGMENYDRFKDVFAREERTKDYMMTGMGFSVPAGRYSFSLVSNVRPPEKKKKVFFGGGSEGPYQVGAASILPGSEKVYLDGAHLQSGYTINYSKGELTFASPLARNNRVVVEYEVAASGAAAPGKFTGFRIETRKDEPAKSAGETNSNAAANSIGAAGENSLDSSPDSQSKSRSPQSGFSWGFSYLKDQSVSYRPWGDGKVDQDYFDQTLMGFDGAFTIGGRSTVGFEVARSSGDKQRELGRSASQTFTIADTRSPDLDPKGPYYLDEARLPVSEKSEEVRLNGLLLNRDTDYTLDTRYGHLKLKKTGLNLTPADVIEVRYRYVTEADRVNTGENVRTDTAHLLTLENNFGSLTHTFSRASYGRDFMTLGGGASNNLRDDKHTLAWKPSDKWTLTLNRFRGSALDDRAAGTSAYSRADNYAVNYKGGPITLNLTGDKSGRAGRNVDDTARKNNLALTWKINDSYNLTYKTERGRNTSLASGAPNARNTRDTTIALSAKPAKTLSADFTTSRGATADTGASSQASNKTARAWNIKYTPFKTMTIKYDVAASDFANALTAGPATPATAATTTASDGNSARDEKIAFNWSPSQKTALTAQKSAKRETYAAGDGLAAQTTLNITRKLTPDLDLSLMRNRSASDRPTQAQRTTLDNIGLKYKFDLLPSGELGIARDTMSTAMTTAYGATPTVAAFNSAGVKYTLSAEPFWKDKTFRLEVKSKTNRNITNGVATADRATGVTWSMEIPFIHETTLKIDRATDKKTGPRPTLQENLTVTLAGELSKLFNLNFSLKTADFTDHTSPEANTHDFDMNIVIKGERKW